MCTLCSSFSFLSPWRLFVILGDFILSFGQCKELERKAFLCLLLFIWHLFLWDKFERAVYTFDCELKKFRFIVEGVFYIACDTINCLFVLKCHGNIAIFMYICEILCNLLTLAESVREPCVEKGFVPLLLRALDPQDDIAMATQACRALGNMCFDNGNSAHCSCICGWHD